MPDLQIDQLATLLAAATLLFYPATISLRSLHDRGLLVRAPATLSAGQGFQMLMPEPTDLDAQWKRIADQITASIDESCAMVSLQTRALREVDGTEYLLERLFEDVPMIASLCGGQAGHADIHV